jgi:hypothetical protein
MESADSDDRVDPLHARKFVAAVQAAKTPRALSERARTPLWKLGLRAGLVSSAVNASIYGVACLADIFPHFVKLDPTVPGLTVLAVVLVSMLSSLAAMGVYRLVERRATTPLQTFGWIAVATLVVSFAAPYAIPGTTSAQAWIQNLMHVVVAAIVLVELRTITSSKHAPDAPRSPFGGPEGPN